MRPISLEALMADKILAVLAHQSPGGRPISHSSAGPRPVHGGGRVTPSRLWAQTPDTTLTKAPAESPTQVLP